MNRDEKIKFLKGLQRGERNAQELHHKDFLENCTAYELNYILMIKKKLKNGIMPFKRIWHLSSNYKKGISKPFPAMNRNEKIKLLQGIKERKISVESLLPPEIYIFMEKNDEPGTYEMNGKEYNQKEYLQFCNGVRKQDRILTFINAKGCEPLKEC
jgi:hypothetical protein